jgi:hypothetical protein
MTTDRVETCVGWVVFLSKRHTNVCCVWLFLRYFTCVCVHTLTWVYTCKNFLDAHISLYFTVYYSITLFNYAMYCNPYNSFECSINNMLSTFLECQTIGSARLSGARCKEFCCTRLCCAVNVITTVSKHVIPSHRKAVCTVTSWLV